MINVKAETAKHLRDQFNIDPNVTALLFDKGILSFGQCRDMLIREEYRKKMQPKEKCRIKAEIAEMFCISADMVRKIVE
jgi:hypothetical protein